VFVVRLETEDERAARTGKKAPGKANPVKVDSEMAAKSKLKLIDNERPGGS